MLLINRRYILMKHCLILIAVFSFASFQSIKALKIDVRVYSEHNFSTATFTVVQGYYNVEATGFHKTLSRFQEIELKASGDQVIVYRNEKRLASAKQIIIKGSHEANVFRLSPKGQRQRDYEDDLRVTAYNGDLIFINSVELEHYVAGVVISEVGVVEYPEFYKIQDIISRTYALKNLNRHKQQSYNLCDAQHCQVYKSRCTLPLIIESTSVTRGDVIVDSAGQLITAAFHSNSGGVTMNSEDVWTQALPYLKAVEDTFANTMSKAQWQDTIPLSSWLAYLGKKYRIPWEDSVLQKVTHFEQPPRQSELIPGILLKDIRSDWKFRSTYFSIKPEGDNLIFSGRGWGHAVGLSQQGAMRMIELGYDYEEVINHYYSGVRIIRLSQLKNFPSP